MSSGKSTWNHGFVMVSWRMWPPKITLFFYKSLLEMQWSQWLILIKDSEWKSPELWVCSILYYFRQECVRVGKARRYWRIYLIIKECCYLILFHFLLHLAFCEFQYNRSGHDLHQQELCLPYSPCHSPAPTRVPLWQILRAQFMFIE